MAPRDLESTKMAASEVDDETTRLQLTRYPRLTSVTVFGKSTLVTLSTAFAVRGSSPTGPTRRNWQGKKVTSSHPTPVGRTRLGQLRLPAIAPGETKTDTTLQKASPLEDGVGIEMEVVLLHLLLQIEVAGLHIVGETLLGAHTATLTRDAGAPAADIALPTHPLPRATTTSLAARLSLRTYELLRGPESCVPPISRSIKATSIRKSGYAPILRPCVAKEPMKGLW